MRLRKKVWARPALESCDFFVVHPTKNIGTWHNSFENRQKIHLELGCGKGGFISELASLNPDINYIAIDIKDEMLIKAKEKIELAYISHKKEINNLKITTHEIMLIHQLFDKNDVISRIYINFCNPWHKNYHKARRLTHINQLKQYKLFLDNEAQIWFKTDDMQLFTHSIGYFEQCGFKITYLTNDLHGSGFGQNIETEHEKLFSSQGMKINFLIAEKKLL
jgi:tRNA (guanine-N7-)-methyltransferase